MNRSRLSALSLVALLLLMAGCASRPINPPIAKADPATGYRFFNRPPPPQGDGTLVILAF